MVTACPTYPTCSPSIQVNREIQTATGVGDNSDFDDDNDGFLDIVDANPKYPGFYLDPNLAGSQTSSSDDSGTTFVGGIAFLLLFTTTIAMALIFGARKLMMTEKKDVSIDSTTIESNVEVEAK